MTKRERIDHDVLHRRGRAAAERLAVPVEEIARRIAARHGLELTA